MEFKKNNQNNKNWLDEDEEWGSLKERVKRQAAQDVARNRYNPTPRPKPLADNPDKVEFNIKFQLPKYNVQRAKAKLKPLLKAGSAIKSAPKSIKNSSAKSRSIAAVVVCLFVAGGAGYYLLNRDSASGVQGSSTDSSSANKDVRGEPIASEAPFEMIFPKGRDEVKNTVRYYPSKNNAVYKDQINTFNVLVTEQPLPDNFKSDPDGELKKTTENSGFEKLTLNGENIFYGRSEKGPESVIFAKKNLLISIVTVAQPVGKEAFKAYAYSLN